MSAIAEIRAAAFDLDGTLVDSIPDLAASANAMRVSLGMGELPRDTVQSYVGDGIGVLVHRALTDDYRGQADETLWQQGFTAFVKHYGANIANATRPYPHTETGLELLKTLGIPLAVVTNKSEVLAVKLLKELNLDRYFSLVVGGDTLPEKKTRPRTPAPCCRSARRILRANADGRRFAQRHSRRQSRRLPLGRCYFRLRRHGSAFPR